MNWLKKRWQRWDAPNTSNELDASREFMTKVILSMLGAILVGVTLLILIGWLSGIFELADVAVIMIIDLPMFFCWWLAYHGQWRLASLFPPFVFYLLAFYLNMMNGPVTTGLLFYPIAILLTGMFHGVAAQLLMVTLSLATCILIGLRSPYVPSDLRWPPLITSSSAFIGIALLQWFSTSQLKQALTRAWANAAELEKRTSELTRSNQELRQEIAARARAEETLRGAQIALRSLADRLRVLHEIDQAILAAESPVAIAQAGLSRVAGLLPCHRSSVTLFDFESGLANILAVSVNNKTQLKKEISIPLEEFGGIEELKLGQVRLMDDLTAQPDCTVTEKQLLSEGFRCILNTPLMFQGKLAGSLNLGSREPFSFTDDHVEIAKELADSLAVAIQNAQLHQASQQQAGALAGLHETALATGSVLDTEELLDRLYRQVQQLLAPDTFLVVLLDSETEEILVALAQEEGKPLEEWAGLRLPLAESGLTGWVLRTQQLLLLGDLETDPLPAQPKHGSRPARSWLGVPMIIRGQVVGVLSVQSFQPHVFDRSHCLFMESLAAQTAIGLSNARLFEETERQLKRVQSLYAIDRAISTSVDLNLTLDVVLNQVTSRLNVDAADILLLDQYSQTLSYAAGCGFRTTTLQHTRLQIGEGGAGKAALERRIFHIPDLSSRHTGFLRSPLFHEEGFVENYAVPLIAKGQLKGVLEIFHRGPIFPDRNWLEFLEALAGQAAIAIDNAELFESLQTANAELIQAYDSTIEGWSRALDLRDKETEGHTQRVTDTTLRMARAMNIKEKDLVQIRRGALLHDIGKMGIPDSILLKPGPLTESEWVVMRRHPVYAFEMLSPIAYLRQALDIPYCHHERWDGTGYPRGLKGEQIPLAARIFAVVDVWDALTSDRPYRKAWPAEKVLEYIQESAGKQFDPQVVTLFLEFFQK